MCDIRTMAMSVLKSVDNIDACVGTLVATRAYQAHLDCSVVYFLCGCDRGRRRGGLHRPD